MTPSIIHAGGQNKRLSAHASEQVFAREISDSWIIQTLENPVVVVDDESRNSVNYYGRIDGRNSLLKVAVSKSNPQLIATVHFDSPATLRYLRGQL